MNLFSFAEWSHMMQISYDNGLAPPGSILIVEDDRDLARLLQLHLSEFGYDIRLAHTGRQALELALGGVHTLIILDLMLPELDGFEICKRVRANDRYVPILMLTARSEELDKVLGLELGADDYLTKPFSIRELLARVKALFRRIEVEQSRTVHDALEPIRFGPLIVDPGKRKVTLEDRPVDLTVKEFDLLLLFAQHPGRAYTRQELLDLVWGYQFAGYSHTVNSHINRLRNKIERDPSMPAYIKTMWGVGYRFTEPDELCA